MKAIFPLLLIIFMISTSCEEGSFSWESNPPEVRLVVLNESDLADKTIGDTITVELSLELYNMQYLYFLDFEVHFDPTIFFDAGYNFDDVFPSFFSTTGDVIIDDNGDGVWEDDEYQDMNGNGVYDEPQENPEGYITLDTTDPSDFFFDGGLGITDPENNGGNAWGTGRVCEFYFSGILTESIFKVDIIQAREYQDSDAADLEHNIGLWDIFTLLIGSPHDPALRLQQENQSEEGKITVSLQIDDAPKIAQLQNIITYDKEVLSLYDYAILDYFDQTNYQVNPVPYNNEGRITLDVTHNVVNNNSIEVVEESFNQGSGEIINVTFLVIDQSDSTSTLTLSRDNVSVMGYSLNESNAYPLDLGYWTIQESLEVNLHP